jgi:hypothetical protein
MRVSLMAVQSSGRKDHTLGSRWGPPRFIPGTPTRVIMKMKVCCKADYRSKHVLRNSLKFPLSVADIAVL